MHKMILHLVKSEKFIKDFVNLISETESRDAHRFFVIGEAEKFELEASNQLVICNSLSQLLTLRQLCCDAQKIIIHGLFDLKYILFLHFNQKFLAKSYWFIWGGDVYSYQNLKLLSKNFLRYIAVRKVAKNIGHLVTYLDGDAALVKKIFSNRGAIHKCILYPSNTLRASPHPTPYQDKRPTESFHIMIGNSADPSNNHFNGFQFVALSGIPNIKIYTPLSYGNKRYANRVAAQGRRLFGQNFFPIFDFLKLDEYLKFLETIDAVVFCHSRQQGMGNLISLLGMGKAIYLNPTTTSYMLLKQLGFVVFPTTKLHALKLSPQEIQLNIKLAQIHFSRDTLISQLNSLFEG